MRKAIQAVYTLIDLPIDSLIYRKQRHKICELKCDDESNTKCVERTKMAFRKRFLLKKKQLKPQKRRGGDIVIRDNFRRRSSVILV